MYIIYTKHQFPGTISSHFNHHGSLQYMQSLIFAHFSKCCKSYSPATQITCDYGFTYIKSEPALPSLTCNKCSEYFPKFIRKTPVVESFYNKVYDIQVIAKSPYKVVCG